MTEFAPGDIVVCNKEQLEFVTGQVINIVGGGFYLAPATSTLEYIKNHPQYKPFLHWEFPFNSKYFDPIDQKDFDLEFSI